MKKKTVMALVLSVTMAAAVTGCGSSSKKTESSAAETVSSAAADTASSTAADTVSSAAAASESDTASPAESTDMVAEIESVPESAVENTDVIVEVESVLESAAESADETVDVESVTESAAESTDVIVEVESVIESLVESADETVDVESVTESAAESADETVDVESVTESAAESTDTIADVLVDVESVIESLVESAEEADLADEIELTEEAPVVDEEMTAENYSDFIDLAEYRGLALGLVEGELTAEGDTVNIDFVGKIPAEIYYLYVAAEESVESETESIAEFIVEEILEETDSVTESIAESAAETVESFAEELEEEEWVAFDGGSAEGYELELGSGSFIDGFEDQLIGHQVGDEVTVTVTFPEEYGVEYLNGQEVVFEVTINDAYHMTASTAMENVALESVVRQYPRSLYDAVAEDMYTSIEETYEYYMQFYSYGTESEADDVESVLSEAEEAEGETALPSDEALAFFGLDQESLALLIRDQADQIMTAEAMLAAEGITSDSEEYQEVVDLLLTYYGAESLDDIYAYGYTENQVVWSVERNIASNLIESLQQ